MKFKLNSDECEILLAFEKSKSLQGLSNLLGKDISVVSRNLKSISQKENVLEKNKGRWTLTELGRTLNRWTENATFSQGTLLNEHFHLRIVTTREFSSRVLVPKLSELINKNAKIGLTILTTDEGIEKYLLDGRADIGFDCGRPFDPLVSHKKCVKESFVCVASSDLVKTYKIKSKKDLEDVPYLSFLRQGTRLSDRKINIKNIFGAFGDLASLREACALGYGWSIVPYYLVAKEIKEKKLKIIPFDDFGHENFSVWWIREKRFLKPWVEESVTWLEKQENLFATDNAFASSISTC